MKSLLLLIGLISFSVFASEDAITKVLGPIDGHLIVAHSEHVDFYNDKRELIKSVTKIDPRFNHFATPRISRIKDYVLLTGSNTISVYDKQGNELSEKKAHLGVIAGSPVLLSDGRILVLSNYQLWGSPSMYATFFKLNGHKLEKDSHVKIKNSKAQFTWNDLLLTKSSNGVYFVDSSSKLISISNKGKVKKISLTSQRIRPHIALSSNEEIIFTTYEDSENIYTYKNEKTEKVKFSTKEPFSQTFLLALPSGDVVVENGGIISLLNSKLELIKEMDLSLLRSRVIQISSLSDNLFAVVVLSSMNIPNLIDQQGLLIINNNLSINHNLLKSENQFSVMDSGSLDNGTLYIGDRFGKLHQFNLSENP